MRRPNQPIRPAHLHIHHVRDMVAVGMWRLEDCCSSDDSGPRIIADDQPPTGVDDGARPSSGNGFVTEPFTMITKSSSGNHICGPYGCHVDSCGRHYPKDQWGNRIYRSTRPGFVPRREWSKATAAEKQKLVDWLVQEGKLDPTTVKDVKALGLSREMKEWIEYTVASDKAQEKGESEARLQSVHCL